MGIYREHVVPRLVELTCRNAGLGHWRQDAAAGLRGQVVEIGFGSGLNVAHYPPAAERVVAVEPSTVARRMAEKRIAHGTIPVEFVGLDGQLLPLDDASCDSALSTFTLCTIPDAARAIAEVHRVLRPGGTFHFLEHGLADDSGVARWQRRLEPMQLRVAGGCHLTREPTDLVRAGGFSIQRAERSFARGPRPWSYFTVGVAVKA
jgi:SAM-dependent methyltransferase